MRYSPHPGTGRIGPLCAELNALACALPRHMAGFIRSISRGLWMNFSSELSDFECYWMHHQITVVLPHVILLPHASLIVLPAPIEETCCVRLPTSQMSR
jgi:hypothetical protein